MKKLQVLGIPRSGTTYLFELISQQINQKFDQGFNESFYSKNKHYKDYNLDQINQAINSKILNWCDPDKCAIAKNHPAHLNYLNQTNLIEQFKSANPYTIVVIRKSVIDVAISHARSNVVGDWRIYTDKTPIEISETIFLKVLKSSAQHLVNLVENPWNLQYNEIVYYEDLTGKPNIDITQLKMYNEHDFTPDSGITLRVERAPDKRETVVNYNKLYNIAVDFYSKLNHPRIKFDGQIIKINPA